MKFNFIEVLKNFKDFKGRSGREDFWSFIGFIILVRVLLSYLIPEAYYNGFYEMGDFLKLVENIFAIITYIPGLALMFRRLHDVGKSGWWAIGFTSTSLIDPTGIIDIPVKIYVAYLAAKKGDIGSNKYGADPKEVISTEGSREENSFSSESL